MIRGDHQAEEFDHNETFTHVAKMTSVRCFLSVTVMMIRRSFYENAPWILLYHSYKICHLKKSLYSLREAP